MSVPSARTHSKAVEAALVAAGLRVGVGRRPAGDLPCVVLYPGGLNELNGPVSDSHADAAPIMQITSVGATVDQTEWARDKAAVALLDGAITVAGRAHAQPPVLEASQPVRRDDDVTPPVFYAVDLYRLSTTPA